MKSLNEQSRHNHFDNVDILRSLLSLGIVWHHMGPPDLILGIPINIPGRVLVWLFYVLSGYVISRGFYEKRYEYSRASVIQFYKKRLLRLLPLLYFVYVAAWFFGNRHEPFWTKSHVQDLLFFHYSFQFDYIGAAWFLGPLIYLYLLSPLLFWAVERFKLRANPLKFLIGASVTTIILKYVSAGLSALLLGTSQGVIIHLDDRTLLGSLGAFLTGAAIWPVYKQAEGRLSQRNWMFIGLSGCAGILAMAVLYEVNGRLFWVLPTVAVVALAGAFVILACLFSPSFLKGKSRDVFKFLDPLSYGLFLWHGLVLTAFSHHVPDYNSDYIRFLLSFAIVSIASYGLSYLSYILVEKNGLLLGLRPLARRR